MTRTNTKEIAKEIREMIKTVKGVKLSVTSDYNHIDVTIMAAPFEALMPQYSDKKYSPVNHYSFERSDLLTPEAVDVFKKVNEIILKYHWDESDAMTDYFNCAFYYSYAVGKWDKPFLNTSAPQLNKPDLK
jgi:hypothetical protein